MARRKSEIEDSDLAAIIAREIEVAADYDTSELEVDRVRALEYLRGEMNDTPSRPNGSNVTSRDLADTISWMLPSIMRVFMSSDCMAEYEPVAPDTDQEGDVERAEEAAEQASDYISYVFMKDNPGYRNVYNATHDALTLKNGIIKHWWDDTPVTEVSHHTRLTIEQVAQLLDDEDVEIIAQEVNDEPDFVMDEETGEEIPVETYNVKIERVTQRGKVRILAVAPENFRISPSAITIDDASFVAHYEPDVTRSDLIERGFDKETINNLPADGSNVPQTELSDARQSDGNSDEFRAGLVKSMEKIDYYECYLRADVNGDGIAETIKADYVGGGGAGEVLHWEEWEDAIPFSDIPCYPRPHRFDAESAADRTVDIQQIKTILQRQGLDNLYASNLPMQEVEEKSVLNPDSLVSPKFGGIIWKKAGSAPITPHSVPFVADKAFQAIEYFDNVLERRTGVSKTMMALDPEALQNQTATANQNAKDASYSQVELVARNMAELGWRRVFREVLKLVVKHQDRPRMIRLRGKFVEMDPRHWNANMDVTVNTGLGTGSRDRDMSMLQLVFQGQLMIAERFISGGFLELGIEMIPRIRTTLIKIAESAGLRNPDAYYPDIEDEQIEQMKQQAKEMAGQPSEAIQIETAKLEVTKQVEQLKAEGNKIKEAAQLEADLVVREAERGDAMQLAMLDAEVRREKIAADDASKDKELQTRILIAQMNSENRPKANRDNA